MSSNNSGTNDKFAEMERTMDTENKNEIIEVNISYEKIEDEIDDGTLLQKKREVHSFLRSMCNVLEIGRNAKKVIDPELDYVVKFTPKLLEKMKENDIRFLKDKATGELLPDLYDYTEKGIGGKVRLVVKGKPTSQDIANLNNAVNNLIEQQRYDNLVEEIRELQVIAKRIERGQDNDRFARVNAGRKHLIDALNYQGTEEDRKRMMFDALSMLREGRELVEKTLVDKLDTIEMVPDGTFRRLWICFTRPDFFEEQTNKYDDILEYFFYYYNSIKPMAYAFTYLGQPHLASQLLDDCNKVFEHKNIGCLRSIEYLLPNRNYENMWYHETEKISSNLLDAYKTVDKEKDVYVRISGKDLLEVADGRTK